MLAVTTIPRVLPEESDTFQEGCSLIIHRILNDKIGLTHSMYLTLVVMQLFYLSESADQNGTYFCAHISDHQGIQ